MFLEMAGWEEVHLFCNLRGIGILGEAVEYVVFVVKHIFYLNGKCGCWRATGGALKAK